MKKYGFTLSEVLITLVVIGIVAAITVPTLNNNTNNEQFRVAAYKNTSVLNNAISRNYAFYSTQIDEYSDHNDLKTNFFYKHFNIFNGDNEVSNSWGGGIYAETSFYLTDGSKYGISEKITNNCDYDIKGREENIPCFFIYVDTNGDKKPNRMTTDMSYYKDIVTFYAYRDRFILWPEDFSADINNPDKPNTPSQPETPNGPDVPETPNNPEFPDTPDKPEDPDDDNDDNNNNDNTMERCLEKRPYEECVKFCEKNGYHSALCR